MDSLDARLARVLFLLGGPTPGNTNLVDIAMSNRLRQIESQMLRDTSQEATNIRLENTRNPQYPVPADHLPTPGPVTFPPSPIGFSYLSFITLFSAVDKYLEQEYRRFEGVQSYAVVESRTLRLLRTFKAQFKATLQNLRGAPQPPQPTPHSMPGSETVGAPPVQAMDVSNLEIRTSIDVWDCYKLNGDVEVLALFAPLLNSHTARVPPLIIKILILHMSRVDLWTEDATRATLEMLASSLIPSLTFRHATTWIVNAFCSQGDIAALRYTFDGVSAAAILELADGRRVTMTDIAAADEFAFFSSNSLSRVRTLSISNLLRSSTAAHIFQAFFATLTSITIELDPQPVAQPSVALLAYRGAARLNCPKLATLRLAASPDWDGHVDVCLADLRVFIASAFVGVPEVEVDPRIRLT